MNAERTKPPDLDAIRARADKATPGPWYPVVNDLVGGWSCSTVNAPASHGPAPTPADFCSLADADFIARAREDIPALLAEIERLRVLVVKHHAAGVLASVMAGDRCPVCAAQESAE